MYGASGSAPAGKTTDTGLLGTAGNASSVEVGDTAGEAGAVGNALFVVAGVTIGGAGITGNVSFVVAGVVIGGAGIVIALTVSVVTGGSDVSCESDTQDAAHIVIRIINDGVINLFR